MSAFSRWSRKDARDLVRRELMDTSAKWWSDTFLNNAIEDWQNDLQQEFELVWGSATITTAINTLTLSSITPSILRLEAVYYGTGTSSGYRLAGRNLQDLEVINTEWRDALGDTPRMVVQYDSTQMLVWPPLASQGTFIFEYPQALSFVDDTSTISLPPWTQWSLKPYVCARAYLRPGPTNDLTRTKRYEAQFQRSRQRVRELWDNYLPERYRKLKPANHYEWNILTPPPAWDTGRSSVSAFSMYASDVPVGVVDSLNKTFTLPYIVLDLKVFLNGLLQTSTVDYTWSASLGATTLTFLNPPLLGDDLVVWVYRSII
jgi:hypothetical protein